MKHQHKTAQKILELIHETVFAFGKQAKWQDDVTVVIVKKYRRSLFGGFVYIFIYKPA